MAPKFYGPFKVIDKVGTVAYHIHNVFHVSQLKKDIGFFDHVVSLPRLLSAKKEFEPAAILERKLDKRGNRPDVHLLVH